MSASVYDRIRAEIVPGERLLWCGRPRGGIHFKREDIFLTLFFLVWTGFSLTAVISFVSRREGVIVVPALFALVGLYMLVGRYPVDAWRRSTTAYGLTNRRAIIVHGLFGPDVRSLPLHTLAEITLRERCDRSGTITCLGNTPAWHRTNNQGMPKKGSLFRMIVDARHVHDLLLDAQAKLAMTRV
ncbi:MAG: hypothetical protein ACRDJH_06555 [Thermomicrobiales bacterium]